MKICLVHRYYWPDTPPYALMLHYIAKELSSSGHDVTVITTQPSYKTDHIIEKQPWSENIDGLKIIRIKLPKENREYKLLRLLNMSVFCLKLFFRLLTLRAEITMISTVPQVAGGLVVHLASILTKQKYIYHCQDIHPEIAQISGILKNKLIYNLLLKIDRSTCNNAKYTIVLSEDMKNTLLQRKCNSDNIVVLNNFELVSPNNKEKTLPSKSLIRNNNIFRIIFAGNIGRFQNLDTLIESAKHLTSYPDIEFVFLGEGVEVNKLKEQAGNLLNQTIYFYGHQPVNIARQLIADSQLSIVSLNDDIYKYAFPSKTMTYLCENCPVLIIANKNSEISKTVATENLGIVSAPDDSNEIATNILTLYRNPNLLLNMKRSISKYSREHYKISNVLPKWVNIFNNIN